MNGVCAGIFSTCPPQIIDPKDFMQLRAIHIDDEDRLLSAIQLIDLMLKPF